MAKWDYLLESDEIERGLERDFASGRLRFDEFVAKMLRRSKAKGISAVASRAARIRISAVDEMDEVRSAFKDLKTLYDVASRHDFTLMAHPTFPNTRNPRRRYIIRDVIGPVTMRMSDRRTRISVENAHRVIVSYLEVGGRYTPVSALTFDVANEFFSYKDSPGALDHVARIWFSIIPMEINHLILLLNTPNEAN